ncbi:MAG: DUF3285 domain-containing protein [Leptolyngbyaceae bacterium]|nr:DUF3285 domain-containing protein [Leptolyngbyaceae bacterium]
MNSNNLSPETYPQPPSSSPDDPQTTEATPQPSYVKLAMRNMVRKRRQSLVHFALTTIGLLAVLIGLAYLTR